MLNTDVIEVFDQVEVGTPVVIRCGGLLLGMLWFCDGFSGVRLVWLLNQYTYLLFIINSADFSLRLS